MPTTAPQIECPYKGLLSYTVQDADIFCGRTKWIQRLQDDLDQQSFVALTGASGSGKTSLIYGGLIPKLHADNNWQIVAFRPKESPFYELSSALIPFLAGHLDPFEQGKEIKRLADSFRLKNVSLFDLSKEIADKQSPESRVLLVIDQFEELYALCPLDDERNLFIDFLFDAVALSDKQSHRIFNVLISLRADFIGQVISDRKFSSYLTGADLKLAPMSSDELREAIELPAQKTNTILEPGFTDYILKICIPGNIPLPLISFSLKCLWEKEHKSALTIRGFEDMGATELTLTNYTEAIYARLSKKEKLQTRHIFLRLVSPGEGTEDVRCIINRNEMVSRNWPLINLFIEKGLLVAERNHNDEIQRIEVVHDILLKEWGRLHGWIQENRDFRLWRKRLQSKMWYWEKNGQKIDDLLSGELLTDSLQWLDSDPEQIEFSEKRYIQTSADKNKPGNTKKRLIFIARSFLITVFLLLFLFGAFYIWHTNQTLKNLYEQNERFHQAVAANTQKSIAANELIVKLKQKIKNSEKKWQEALDKVKSADLKIKEANKKLQEAQDIKWRAERQIAFATEKLKKSKTVLADVQGQKGALKEQTQEFEQHYQQRVEQIKAQKITLSEQQKQVELKMAAAEKLAIDARGQLQLVSEKKAQMVKQIQAIQQEKTVLLKAACAFTLTHLALDQWQAMLENSPLKTLCEQQNKE